MNRRTNFLLEGAPSVPMTRLDRGVFRGSKPREPGELATGPVRTGSVPFTLVAGIPQKIAAENLGRVGLILQNKDPTNNLFYEFGMEAGDYSTYLFPNSTILLDFVCPVDEVWVFASVALSGAFKQFGRG